MKVFPVLLVLIFFSQGSEAKVIKTFEQPNIATLGVNDNPIKKLDEYLERLPGLIAGINVRIPPAAKLRKEFQAEADALKEELTHRLSSKERRNIQIFIASKDSCMYELDGYLDRLNSAKEYFVRVSHYFEDRRKSLLVIDKAFIVELAHNVQEIAKLLMDPTIKSIMENGADRYKI